MTLKHAALWLDHHAATLVYFGALEEASETRHFKHPANDHLEAFYRQLAGELKDAREILVMGPGQAKGEFVKYLKDHAPATAKAVMEVVAADHPSDGQILAQARKYFEAKDRMIAH